MKEHEEVAPSSYDDAMECSQPVDLPPAASQSVASEASQQERPAPVYAELWGRLKWLSVINEKTLEGMYSKGDLQAMLRRHAIHAASGRKKSELAVELMRLMRAQGLSKPDEPTAATEPPAACTTATTSSSAAGVTTANTIAAVAATTTTTSAAGFGVVGSSGALASNSLADRLGNMCRGPPADDDDETQPPSQSQRVVTPPAPPAPPPPAPPRAVRAAPPAPSPGLLRRIPLPPPPALASASVRKPGGGRGGGSGIPGTAPRVAPRAAVEGATFTSELWGKGSKVEAFDEPGTWYEASVVDERGYGNARELLVHYRGYKAQYNEWLCASGDRLRAAGRTPLPPSRDAPAAAAPPPPAAAARPPLQAAAPPPRAVAPPPPAAAPVPAAALPPPRLMALSASEEQLLHSLKARAVPPAWPAGCFAALALDLARLPRAAGLHSTAYSPPTPPANNAASAAAANASANTKAANAANAANAAEAGQANLARPLCQ